jgi:hypothetical protein
MGGFFFRTDVEFGHDRLALESCPKEMMRPSSFLYDDLPIGKSSFTPAGS